ncbi:MAG: dTDP-glucose 4,6-dehydratase [Devosia sp.]
MTILVTGGAGFIGSNFVLDWLEATAEPVVNLDALTYAGNLANLASISADDRHRFVRGSISDTALVSALLRDREVRAVVNFAAETHVDRSISGPAPFFETNVMGALHLLEAVRDYLDTLDELARRTFRFIHISTDEVYGTLLPAAAAFTEAHPYRPNSPYAASKAASDHLVRAFGESYGLSAIVTNCSNNYGRFQFPEKLIPLMINNALAGKALPVYGDGLQIRDWLHVRDHCVALRLVLEKGVPGDTYNIGSDNQLSNIDVVTRICELLDRKRPRRDGQSYATQIAHVADRPGHDRRYAIDASKLRDQLGWLPSVTFETGLEATIDWYLTNEDWLANVTSGAYRDWIVRQYG